MKRIVLTLCKHFPINHSFRQVFNLNTIKLSFSSMVNMTNLIKQHNARILKNEEHTKKEVKNMECKECKNTSEQLKESLNCATIITRCHLDTKHVNDTELSKYLR